MKYFDYTLTIHGATIVALDERLSTASLSQTEIDTQVSALKADLDRVAKAMKAAIMQNRPLGLRTINKSGPEGAC